MFSDILGNQQKAKNIQDEIPKTSVSKPVIEEFKSDARRIGGKAFPSPKINALKIAREPSINSSSYSTRNTENITPVFLMHRPLVEDITTIVSGKKIVTIAGIKPLPIDQTCSSNGITTPCGMLARTALRGLVRGRTLNCKATINEDQNRITTSCKVGKIDIAEWLVKRGWTTVSSSSQSQ